MHCISYTFWLYNVHIIYESFAIKQTDKIYRVLGVLGILLGRSIQYFTRLNDVGTLPGKHSHSFPLKQ